MKFNIWDRELFFDIDKKVIIYKDKIFIPSIRTYSDMEKLYKTPVNIDKNTWLYYMFIDVYFSEEDKEVLRRNNIRYDITILIPYVFWNEFNKTYGHFHPKNKDENDYREIYQVLSWEAIYLQQNNNEVFYTKAVVWDQVIMETWFWHVTINSNEEKFLIIANYVEEWWNSIYNEYEKLNWANYIFNRNWFEKNLNYNNDLKLIEKKSKFGNTSMYDDFFNESEKFNFLH